MRRQPFSEIKRAQATNIMGLVIGQLVGEFLVGLRRLVGAFNLQDQRHQRLGDKASAMHAEPAALVGLVAKEFRLMSVMINPWVAMSAC